MPTYLVCADVHLGRTSAGFGPEKTTAAAWLRLCDRAAERGVDAVVVAGDLVDGSFALPRAQSALAEGFRRMDGIPVCAVRGNHDHASLPALAGTFGSALTLLDCPTACWKASELPGGAPVVAWGFSAARCDDSCFDTIPFEVRPSHLGVIHADVGASTPGYNAVRKQSLEQEHAAGMWVVGHVHRPAEGRNWFYPGSLQPMDMGELGPRSAYLVEWTETGFRKTPLLIADAEYRRLDPELPADADLDTVTVFLGDLLATASRSGSVRVRLRPKGRSALTAKDWSAIARSLHEEYRTVLESLDPCDVRPAWDLDAWAQLGDARGLLSRLLLRATDGQFSEDDNVTRMWDAAVRRAPSPIPIQVPYDDAFPQPEEVVPPSEAIIVRRAAERLLELL